MAFSFSDLELESATILPARSTMGLVFYGMSYGSGDGNHNGDYNNVFVWNSASSSIHGGSNNVAVSTAITGVFIGNGNGNGNS